MQYNVWGNGTEGEPTGMGFSLPTSEYIFWHVWLFMFQYYDKRHPSEVYCFSF